MDSGDPTSMSETPSYGAWNVYEVGGSAIARGKALVPSH